MCGIVGIYSKSIETTEQLGGHLAAMLVQMADRGPDSAGVAVYRDPVGDGRSKLSLRADAAVDWDAVAADLDQRAGLGRLDPVGERFAVAELAFAEPAAAAAWMRTNRSDLHVVSAGRSIEIYKDATRPEQFAERFGLAGISATHALGHTRMATESQVTADGAHPFSTGRDLCLVHNGSLSNHHWLRADLEREGTVFRTENDSEVAAGYLTWRLAEGDSLEAALSGCLDDLDGFYTFAVGTADGFAVLRDPIACKPAVMAETDSWVAMASEFRALAVLPGAADAQVWEPEPGVVYSWGQAIA